MVFKPGEAQNPGGKVRGVFSHEALQLIASGYLTNHSKEEILALYEDKKRFGKLTVAHTMVIERIVASLAKDGRLDFDCVMDRLIGKAVQKNEIVGAGYDRREAIASIFVQINTLHAGKADGRAIDNAGAKPQINSPNEARALSSLPKAKAIPLPRGNEA